MALTINSNALPQVHIDNPALGPYSQARPVRMRPFRPERMANTIYQVQETQIAHTITRTLFQERNVPSLRTP